MKNKIFLILLAAVLAISLSILGCGEIGPTPVELTLIFSDHNPPGNAIASALEQYGEYIAGHSGGKVTVNTTAGGAIMKDYQVWEGVPAGMADAASYVPAIGDGVYYLQVIALPGMGWADRHVAVDIFWALADLFPEIMGQITNHGCTLATLYMMPAYQFHLFAEDLVVDSPDDLNGMEILSLEDNLCNIIDTIPGVTPVKIAFFDLFSILPSPGTRDGFAMHGEFLNGAYGKDYLYSHAILPGSGIQECPIGVLWDTAKYEECLDIVGQDVMDAAAAVWLKTAFDGTAVDTAAILQFWSTRGDTVTYLTAEQAAVFAEYFNDYIETWIQSAPTYSSSSAKAQDIYDEALDAIAAS